MTSPQQIEILDLRHFTAKQLRPLLDEAAVMWRQRLRWDYRSSTDLLLEYLDSRILPGFVALDRGRVCGYTFCVYEGAKAVVGDLYTTAAHPTPMAVNHTLARHLLETLDASPGLDRIEAQLLLFDAGVLRPLFAASAVSRTRFTVFPRLFLERTLPPPALSAPTLPQHLRHEFELSTWTPSFYDPCAQLILDAYRGHIDSDINDQYRTLHGCLRFLHNIIRFPGCGVFDPESSWVLRQRNTGAFVAVMLCSRVAPDVAHVTQLCAAQDFRGRHLGSMILDIAMRHLPSSRYRALTLTVSEANSAAVKVYHAAGFTLRNRFDALVLDKPRKRPYLL